MKTWPNRALRFTFNVSHHSSYKYTLHHLILPTILLADFALRFYRLGAQSLWYDETVSAFLASQSTFDLVAHTARDIHPPGYYLFLHFWTLVAGNSEFALAAFSSVFGVLLVPLTYRLARQLADKSAATWTALLVAFSPFNIWYSQEVRMYTLGALLGLIATLCLLHARIGRQPSTRWYWSGYFISAAFGLYTLYYLAFLLIVVNLLVLCDALFPKIKRATLLSLVAANGLLIVTYLPWLPIAWRQATNPPVPPWRTPTSLWAIIVESWSALSLGQSVEPDAIWPMLLLTLVLFILGLWYLRRVLSQPAAAPLFLFLYTFGPLLFIYFLSFISPLYHVRYIFTYATAFYIILGAGIAWLASRGHVWATVFVVGLLLGASLFSIYRLHFNPRYRADDYRSAVRFIQSHWQPGDVIVTNAGYTYTAFLYYSDFSDIERKRLVPYEQPSDLSRPLLLQTGTVDGSPQLGWGDPRSDFYAMSAPETVAALEKISDDFYRLWMLRAYDTVTDPTAFIRTWLANNTIPIEDERFAGESSIHAQGFLLARQPSLQGETVYFGDGMALAGWRLPEKTWQAGQTIHLILGWKALAPASVDYKMSLKLWTSRGELAAQGQDEWPVGSLYRATAWPIGQIIYHPAQITLPADLPSGQYWLNVELYHPETVQPLPRLDGSDPVVTLGQVVVQ